MRPWWQVVGVTALLLSVCGSLADFTPSATFSYKSAEHSTVLVLVNKGDQSGSGVVIGPGLILTAKHVVMVEGDKGGKEKVATDLVAQDNQGGTYTLSVAWLSQDSDLAVLKGKLPSDMQPVAISCDRAEVGTPIVKVGNPLALRWVFSWGHVASNQPFHDREVLDLTLAPGDSGGPIFNTDGQLVGIADAFIGMGMFGAPTGYTLMVPASALCKLVPTHG